MSTLLMIAVANAVVWTGLFLILLFALMRNHKDIDAQLERLESRLKKK